jgi:ABC-type branched-subunit amino acid transport system ATPase component
LTGTALAEPAVETSVDERPPLLEVDDVDFSYGPLQVLFGVSLTVPTGSRIAILGTNGAGKSTLLRVIAGLAECGSAART